MNTITDYVQWYADFSFYEAPFGEVDNLVLSALSYYRYDLKKSQGRPAALRRCIVDSASNNAFLKAVCASARFGSLLVTDYTEVFDRAEGIQFSAVTFRLYENVYYVAFRGTDNSLVGWREDFMISYRSTPAQSRAVSYLDEVMRDGCEYIIGGHSKGGNLALYACCHLSDERLRQVKHIYNNDGPGLCPDVSDVSLIERIKARTTVILPQYCIFGRIFAHENLRTKIVAAANKGIDQHDLLCWGVRHGKLDTVRDFDPESLWINDVADKWIRDVAPQEREQLVASLFDTFEQNGATTYNEALSGGLDSMENLLKNMVEQDTVKTAAKIPEKVLFGDFLERLRTGKLSKLINANQLIEGIILSVVGALMLIFPSKSFSLIIIILLGGVVAFQLFYTLRKLYESKWNFARERTRVYILVAVATVFALILVKKQAIFIVGSGIAGAWLLVVAYRSFLAVKESAVHDFAYYKNIVKAIIYLIAGVFILVAPVETLRWFVLSLGAVMAIDGLCTVIYSFIQANDRYSEKYDHLKNKVMHKK